MSLSPVMRGRFRLPARLALTLLLPVLAMLIPSISRAQAQDAQSLSPGSLVLPLSDFPRGSRVAHVQPGNPGADQFSELHAGSFADLGRQSGIVQTASWQVPVGTRHSEGITLRYSASIFSSTAQAAAAYGDAAATLWEIGTPIQLASVSEPGFRVRERQYGQVDVVLHAGLVEVELRVRLRSAAGKTAQGAALTALQKLASAAADRISRLASSSAPSLQPVPPPLYVAPPGTGPVTKSPSLMALAETPLIPGTPPDPGAFRGSARAALAARALPAASVVPAASLSRFVRTGRVVGQGVWYNSVTLYADSAIAAQAFRTLRSSNASLGVVPLGALAGTTETAAWRAGGEVILAYRCDNLISILADTRVTVSDAVAAAGPLVASVPSWLHASGTQIVDARGTPVHLVALNWYGAEQQDFVVGGLDYQSYGAILQRAQSLGYNTIRLPFSDQLVEQNPIVTSHVAASPELSGLHALDILDRIIAYAGALGMRVILDNHRSEAGWSSQPNGLWYTDQYPESAFVQDWITMARRYAATNAVIGTDLRNEPHGAATWGDGKAATDWHAAAQRAGNAVLSVNPHALVIVEGIQFYGTGPSAWWGGNLMGVATAPVVLQFPDGTSARSQLVYSPHDYGPDMCGSGCPWFNGQTTYASLSAVWDQYWGYIAANPSASYAAPVWLGEFGTCNFQQQCVADPVPGSQGQWFSSLVRYLGERNLGWAYWSMNGTQSTGGDRTYGNLDWYGLLRQDWSAPTPWLLNALQPIMPSS